MKGDAMNEKAMLDGLRQKRRDAMTVARSHRKDGGKAARPKPEAIDREHEVFSGRLRAAIAQRRATRASLSRVLEVSTNTLSSWANGQSLPTLRNVVALGAFLDVSLAWLLDVEPLLPDSERWPAAVKVREDAA